MINKTFKNHFQKEISKLSESDNYINYTKIRSYIFKMLSVSIKQENKPSHYWEEELQGFQYMLDASPIIIEKLRHHTYHLTGIHEYTYRKHHQHLVKPTATKLKLLQKLDQSRLQVFESPTMGGFGHNINGNLYNTDTLKFYECLIALDKSGIITQLKNKKSTILEIGAGWGGFAYQLKRICPNITYIIVDLPMSLLFSSTYLSAVFPSSKSLFITEKKELKKIQTEKFDFIYIPHYLWADLNILPPDLIVNMVSFQEMTTKQVDSYVKKSSKWGSTLYSLNRDRSPHNRQLTSVSTIINKYYNTKKIDLLNIDYNEFRFPIYSKLLLLKSILPKSRKSQELSNLYKYKHLLGTKV